MRLEYFSNVKDGKLQANISKIIAEDLKQFEGKRIHLTMERNVSKRTLPQNALFHMYVGIIADHLGYELEEMKEIIKFKYCKVEKVDEKTGEVFEMLELTRYMNKLRMMQLIEQTIRFAAGFKIVLPDPSKFYDTEDE